MSLKTNLSLGGPGNDSDLHQVNVETTTTNVVTFAGITAVVLLAVNLPILWAITKEKNCTFINILVGLDCIDSLAHIPILGVFNDCDPSLVHKETALVFGRLIAFL